MPYITKDEKKRYDKSIHAINTALAEVNWKEGHVNYIITRILWRWFTARRSYATINAICGVLSCVDKEFYRKKAVPYEREKEAHNGPV